MRHPGVSFCCLLQGDTCNLIGCLLTGTQLQTQVYTAMCGPFPPAYIAPLVLTSLSGHVKTGSAHSNLRAWVVSVLVTAQVLYLCGRCSRCTVHLLHNPAAEEK